VLLAVPGGRVRVQVGKGGNINDFAKEGKLQCRVSRIIHPFRPFKTVTGLFKSQGKNATGTWKKEKISI
jgi:hypothetical protein